MINLKSSKIGLTKHSIVCFFKVAFLTCLLVNVLNNYGTIKTEIILIP